MPKSEAMFPIQPDIVRGTHNYQKIISQWNPYTKNLAVFFQFEVTEQSRHEFKLLPDGCIELLFRCSPDNPSLLFFGKRTKMQTLSLEPGYVYFGFRPFYEAGFKLDDFHYLDVMDKSVDITRHPGYQELQKLLSGAGTFKQRCEIFSRKGIMESFWDRSYNFDYVIECSRQICMSRGLVNISELGEHLGYSDRHLRRFYKDIFGISPVAYKEILQFQSSVHFLIQMGSAVKGDFAALSADCGYCDQSYMINAYKKLINMTPKAYYQSIQRNNE